MLEMNSREEGVMVWRARAYIAFVILLGIAALATANWSMRHPAQFACYLVISILASAMKVNLPGILGTMSVNFLFILIGILDMSAGQTLLMGCLGALVQCVWKPKRTIGPLQTLFSVMNMAVAVYGSYAVYHAPLVESLGDGSPVALIVTALVYFALNTTGIAAAVGLTERKSIADTWRTCYFWSFPFYLVGASIAWVFTILTAHGHFSRILLLVPVIYVIYRSYRMYLDHLEDEKSHVEEMAALHLRTIEALALAIEAKDHTTHEHLNRVRVYAVELAKEMRLSNADLEALRAASLLHDIGKLAVPEHIISKPGKLTPEEFEKMKIHPVVGAEILKRVEFPYPVVPIVRSHHEKWDGSGYPDGLQGEEIPIGARILAAVDCLDALASDRQYRRALPLDEAMAEVARLAGKSFDPKVVKILQRRYVELEKLARSQPEPANRLSTDIKVDRGEAPAAGFEASRPVAAVETGDADFLSCIAAARQEVQLLFELTQDLGKSLSLDETLSVVAARLRRMVAYDAIAVYICRDGKLVPQYVNGESFRYFSSLEIPIGQGLSGWVAETGRTILNGNPAVESGYPGAPARTTTLRSAVAVPLVGLNGTMGVLTLYRAEKDSFCSDHLRILLAIASKVSLSVENALKFRQAEATATTDYLTELPNARSLFLRLDSELARCRRSNESLAVLVCDLDGFKQINDRHGHLVGNKVLRSVGGALRDSCREYDYVGRMGGDEFVLLLPGSTREEIQRRVTQLAEIGASAGSFLAGVETLTMSVGEAFFPEDGGDAEQLLAEADRRMYAAKKTAKVARAISEQAPALADTPTEEEQCA
ncbi:MAG TPA: HD domain-containing phosphohydrolase [Bryobacteraceae bacterium]|nr:HD domain-containing phosphohydrolase [Bryobacteraceae bacterium]